MTIAELGSVGEFLGAIAVIVTLVALTFQIRQGTKALRVNAYSSFVDRHIQMIQFQAQYADILSAAGSGDELSEVDRSVHVIRLSGTLRNGDALHYQWTQGLLDDQRWRSSVDAIVGVISDSPLNREIWEEFKHRYNEDYRRELDERLLNTV